MKLSLFLAVLLSIGLRSVVVTGDDRPRDCCLTVSNTRIPVENIVKYDRQEPTTVCPIRAVRFLTKKDNTICSDPDSKWAKNAMKTVDGRTTTKPTIKPITCFTSTTKMSPTTTTTNKTPGTETETSTSTTEPPKVTIETTRPKPEISTTTTQQTSVSKETPESSSSTVITCGTIGPGGPPTETDQITSSTATITETSTATTTATPKTTKPSPLIIKRRRKSKKQLHRYQSKPKG